jgi:heptosyltransferase-1
MQQLNGDIPASGTNEAAITGNELLGRLALLARPTPDAIVDSLHGRPLRVLVIGEDALGDVVTTASALRAIAQAYPGTTVDLVTAACNAELVNSLPYINDAIFFQLFDRRRLGPALQIFRRRPYDVAIDALVGRPRVTARVIALMVASRAPYWIGETGRPGDGVYNVRIPRADSELSHVERMMRLAAPLLPDATAIELRPHLPLHPLEPAWADAQWSSTWAVVPRVLLNVGSDSPEPRWPVERFAAVADYVRRERPSAAIIVVGPSSQSAAIELLAAGVNGLALIPTVRQLMSLTATADLVVTPTGPVCHLASAYERPLVSLHRAASDARSLFATPGRRVVGTSTDTFLGVETLAVLEALDDVLAAIGWRPWQPTAVAS